jgi:hypothetical protein
MTFSTTELILVVLSLAAENKNKNTAKNKVIFNGQEACRQN